MFALLLLQQLKRLPLVRLASRQAASMLTKPNDAPEFTNDPTDQVIGLGMVPCLCNRMKTARHNNHISEMRTDGSVPQKPSRCSSPAPLRTWSGKNEERSDAVGFALPKDSGRHTFERRHVMFHVQGEQRCAPNSRHCDCYSRYLAIMSTLH